MIKIKAARYGFPECSDGGGTPELEGDSGVNRGEAQLRANFEACKLQANSALQRCTVTPRPSNCALATDFEARFLRLASPCRRLAWLTIPTRFLEKSSPALRRELKRIAGFSNLEIIWRS